MACENLSCIGAGGCVEALANGAVGEVITIGAGGTPEWTDAELHPAATAAGNPALTVDEATQVITLDLDAAGSFTPAGSGLISTTIDDAIKELAECCHDPVTLSATGSPALTLAGQELTLSLTADNVAYTGPVGGPLQGFTNVDDTLDGIANCIVCSVEGGNTCADGGIGTEYSIRSASVANGVLTINGQPEHYTAGSTATGTPTTRIEPLPLFDNNINPISASLTNPSGCRSMLVNISWSGYGVGYLYQNEPGPTWYIVGAELTVDGVTPGDFIASSHDVYFAISGGPGSVQEGANLATPMWQASRVLLPGASITVAVSAVYFGFQPSASASNNSAIDIEQGTIQLIGTTF